ncbi:MAG: molybdopterin-dependent oxidoreductase [Bryobacterales bacterium]|nr:molybdopterin-dependent oxidoreductase [Bryobacterales bacterium]
MCNRVLLFFLLMTLGAAAQDSTPSVQITGGVTRPLTLTSGDLARMPRATLKASDHGVETVYEGVWVHEVLKRAGVPQGDQLRGKALAAYVLVHAQDGYQVVYSLAELDPSFTGNQVLLADTANGKPLFGERGRFQLVAPGDKAHARSVRMLTGLEVVQLRK